MVARVLFPVLTCGGNALTPPPPGDHQRTLLANATKRAIRQGDHKGSPLLYTSESACQARVE